MTGGVTEQRPTRPLWALLEARDEFESPDSPLLTVVSDYGVRLRDLSDGRAPSEDLSGYRVVHKGDLVVNKMWARFGAYGVAEQMGIISPAYWVLRPRSDTIHPRFLHHLLRSSPYRAEIWRRSKDLPPNGFDLSWDQFKTITLSLPTLARQRAIAGYLDRETSRIDAIVTAKRRMVELLEKRAVAFVEDGAFDAGWPPLVLSRVIRRIEQGWSPQCDARLPDGNEWGVLKVGCVNRGHFRPDELKALPTNLLPRGEYLVRDGDLLMSRANTRDLVGSTAVVSNVRPRTLLCDKLYRLLLDQRKALPRFVSLWLQTRAARDQIELDATGASDSMQNVGQDTVRRLVIPLPDLESQKAFVARCDQERARIAKAVNSLLQQADLLQERRQALITAAVTGQLDIPEAA